MLHHAWPDWASTVRYSRLPFLSTCSHRRGWLLNMMLPTSDLLGYSSCVRHGIQQCQHPRAHLKSEMAWQSQCKFMQMALGHIGVLSSWVVFEAVHAGAALQLDWLRQMRRRLGSRVAVEPQHEGILLQLGFVAEPVHRDIGRRMAATTAVGCITTVETNLLARLPMLRKRNLAPQARFRLHTTVRRTAA